MNKIIIILIAIGLALCSNIVRSQDLSEKEVSISDYVISNHYWNKTNLKYYIYNSSTHLTAQERENVIINSFAKWSAVTNFSFEQINNPSNADIVIKWAVGDHNCNHSFTTNPYELAHTVTTYSTSGIASYSEIHFNDSKNWTLDPDEYINLNRNATHEIGHVLGLAESDVSDAIMFYADNKTLNLTADDIYGIWDIYNCPLYQINGDIVISQNSVYVINNFPYVNGINVLWSISDSYYNSYCLQQNSPSSNQCTITRVSGHDMYNATLTAAIKRNGTTVKTITKTGIYSYSGFYGTYYNGQTSKSINLPTPLYVLPNTLVIINSPNLVNATVSHSGATPTDWIFTGNNGVLKVGMSSIINTTTNVHVVCENGSTFDLPIVVTNNLSLLSVIVSEGQIEVSISPESESYQTGFKSDDVVWTQEVYNATSLEKVFAKTVKGKSYVIDTTGWKHGVYVVKVTIGKEVYSEKVVIK